MLTLLAASAGCGDAAQQTCSPTPQAVVADANGNVYVAGSFCGSMRVGPRVVTPALSNPENGSSSFLFQLAPSGDVAWAMALRTNYEPPLSLLAPASGGVIVTGGGATAQRFDDSGKRVWAIGNAEPGLSSVALTGQDHLVVVTGRDARLFDGAGGLIASFSLPMGAYTSVVAGDGGDGFWLIGSFVLAFPPFITQPLAGPVNPGGLFVLHLDGAGAFLGGGAWDLSASGLPRIQQAVAVQGTGVAPELVVLGLTGNPLPAFGVTDGGRFVAALDPSGQASWARSNVREFQLATDAEGQLFAFDADGTSLIVERWDAGGAEIGRARFPVEAQTIPVPTGAASGGIVVVDTVPLPATRSNAFVQPIFRVGSADLNIDMLSILGS
jgi:hypothetical protein